MTNPPEPELAANLAMAAPANTPCGVGRDRARSV